MIRFRLRAKAVFLVFISSLIASHAWAQEGPKYGEALDRAGAADGEAGAALGVTFHNLIFPDHPLPYTDGDVIQKTLRNLGKGQSLKDAAYHAAEENSGVPDPPEVEDNKVLDGGAQATPYPECVKNAGSAECQCEQQNGLLPGNPAFRQCVKQNGGGQQDTESDQDILKQASDLSVELMASARTQTSEIDAHANSGFDLVSQADEAGRVSDASASNALNSIVQTSMAQMQSAQTSRSSPSLNQSPCNTNSSSAGFSGSCVYNGQTYTVNWSKSQNGWDYQESSTGLNPTNISGNISNGPH